MTLKKVAAEVGLGYSTVSLILSGRGDAMRISQKTQSRVQKAAQQLGYRPNPLANALRGGRTHAMGILWPLSGTPTAALMMQDLMSRSQKREYISNVVESYNDPIVIDQTLDDFARRRMDGVVVHIDRPKEVESRLMEFPAAVMVIPGRVPLPEPLRVDTIHQDHLFGIRQSARYFLSQSRRRPAFVYADKENLFKGDAFFAEFERRGVHPSADAVVEIPSFDGQAVWDGLETRFPDGRIPADAVYCFQDAFAAVFMKWLRSHGVKVPDEVAVVGLDDCNYCRWLEPPLASVHRNDEKIVEEIERLIFSRLETPDLPPRSVTVPMTFAHRESAG